MGDSSAAQIEIGGVLLSSHAIVTLVEAISLESCGLDWEGGFEDDLAILAAIHNSVKAGQPIRLLDNSAPGGMFENLEGTCRDLKLPYHRCDDGHYAYAACHSVWFPGMVDPLSAQGTTEEPPAIAANLVLNLSMRELHHRAEILMREVWPLKAAEGVLVRAENELKERADA